MIPEWELWACANAMIRQYGTDAAIQAAMRADELFESGDDDGAATWRMIIHRIEKLRATPNSAPH